MMPSEDPLTITSGPDPVEVENAKGMCLSLLDTVKQGYQEFKERGPPHRASSGSYGGGGGYGNDDRGGYGRDRNNSAYGGGSSYNGGGNSQYDGNSQYGGTSSYGYNPQTPAAAYGGAQSPTAATPQQGAAQMTPEQTAAWAAYWAANPSEDPYAAYGGYAAVMQQYAAVSAPAGTPQQAQGYNGYYGGQAGSPANGAGGAPPPPPSDDGAAPPPPPPGASGAGYNSVSAPFQLVMR